MNKTKTGALAVGSSMSTARIKSEIERALEIDIYALNDTQEGLLIIANYEAAPRLVGLGGADALAYFAKAFLLGMEAAE